MGTETQEMVEEEVVQFVRADQVLCLLLDVAVLVCRDQFGADRRVDDIQQGEAGGIVHLVIGNPFDRYLTNVFGMLPLRRTSTYGRRCRSPSRVPVRRGRRFRSRGRSSGWRHPSAVGSVRVPGCFRRSRHGRTDHGRCRGNVEGRLP